jgi:hypothetical protein
VESEESENGSELTDIKSDLIELVIKGSLVIFLLELGLDETEGREFTNHNGDHLTLSRGDRASRLDDGGRKGMLVDTSSLHGLMLGKVTFSLLHLSFTDRGDVFHALVRFTSHGRLVTSERSFNKNSVNGDLVTLLEAHEVSDKDSSGVNGQPFTVSNDVNLNNKADD